MLSIKRHQKGQYVICGGSDQYWQATKAKTLNGAKMIASKTYAQAFGGKIEVAIDHGDQYELVAVKHGYDSWRQA